MVTVIPALISKPNKEGKYQVAIRITKERKSSYVRLGQYVDKSQWDGRARRVKKNHPNSTRLNALISKKLSEVNKLHLSNELEDKQSSAQTIHKVYLNKKEKSSFFDEAEKYLANLLQEGKYNRYVSNKPRVERFQKFLKGKDIKFEEITVSLLNQFKAYLKGKHKVSERTAINYLIVIRTIYNQGIKSGLVDQKFYPFGKDKMPIRFPDSVKLGLSKEELETLVELDLSEHPKMHHARNVWLFSFYFAGMRVSDVLRLKWSDLKEGRLYYTMGKNNKTGSLKIPDQALLVLEEYKATQRSKDDVIFPELKMEDDFTDKYLVQRKISYGVKNLNKYLKKLGELAELDKKLTMHIARHTFGNISGDRIPIQMLQKLYRHSNVTTTINYQKSFILKDADEALEAVLSSK